MPPKSKDDKKKSPREALAALRAKHNKESNVIGTFKEVISRIDGYSTGNIALDEVTHCGGYPVGRIVEQFGEYSSGKAQRWSDVVHTPDRGFVKITDLKVGDRLSSPRGEESVLEAIFPQGEQETYRISFSDGTSAVSTLDHLWEVEVMTMAGLGYVRTVVPLRRLQQKLGNKYHLPVHVRLPDHAPVECDPVDLPLHPYLLGALLGDGGLTNGSPILTTMDQEVVDRVASCLPPSVTLKDAGDHRSQARSYRLSGGQRGGTANPVTEALRDVGLWGHSSLEKFIPDVYLNGSLSQRISLLQGLMDTDGYAPKKRGSVTYFTSSHRLAADVAWLARSLGCAAFVREKSPAMSANRAYRVEFRPPRDLPVFGLRRKADLLSAHQEGLTRRRSRNIVSIEPYSREECVCIKVSAPSRLYFTNDFIPTHNTTSALQALVEEQRRIIAAGTDEYVMFLDYERSGAEDYAAKLGLDTEHESCIVVKPESFEHGANIFREMLVTGGLRIAVFDSVASMVTEKERESETGKANVADRARVMHQFLRQITADCERYRTTPIFCNHSLEVVDTSPIGQKLAAQGIKRWTQPGGRALGFYSSLRIEFKKTTKVKTKEHSVLTNTDESQVSGQDITAVVVKNKVGAAFGTAPLRIRYGKGFSQPYSVLSLLKSYKMVKVSGAWCTFPPELLVPGVDPQWNGEDAVLTAMENSPEWLALLESAVRAKLAEHGEMPETVDGSMYDSDGNLKGDVVLDDELSGVDPLTGEISWESPLRGGVSHEEETDV